MDPLIAFFVFGFVVSAMRSELVLPDALTDTLSILLLLAIGLKGGVALAGEASLGLLVPTALVILMGVVLTLVAFTALRRFLRLDVVNAAALAGHYGSVSVGTFAVAGATYAAANVHVEPELALYAVLLEGPALVVAIFLARTMGPSGKRSSFRRRAVLREIILGKSIVLLLGGLILGGVLGREGIAPVAPLFFDGFRALLALFLMGLGLACGARLASLRSAGPSLLAFALVMPLIGAAIGLLLGLVIGTGVGGTAMLATLGASASYIAAPAAFRIALPEANLALALTASLGVTFPFNVLVGIPLYLEAARAVLG